MIIRHFPAPWHAEKMPGGYLVHDALKIAKLPALLTREE
jgi:hypothetical protein